MNGKLFLFCLFSFLAFRQAGAQLDTLHFIPPFHAPVDRGEHYLYLSTPEKIPFYVSIHLGNGSIILDASGQLLDSVPLSNTTPSIIFLGSEWNLPTLVELDQVNTIVDNKGLIIRGQYDFYCNLRVVSTLQGASLTSKGSSALGTDFRLGHIEGTRMTASTLPRSNVFSVMATSDNTKVVLSDFDPNVEIETLSGSIAMVYPFTFSLQKGQSFVVSVYYGPSRPVANVNGLMGARVTSDHPIVVNTGSWLGSPFDANRQDIGIDQIVPTDLIGTEYIIVRGDGPNTLETPIVIATQDATSIFVNDEVSPLATIDAGDWLRIPAIKYTPQENMYIHSDHPIYVYQMLAGSTDERTGGLNFIPSIGCKEDHFIDNIVNIDQIGGQRFTGKLFIVSKTDKDLFINDNVINPSLLQPVIGKPDYVTYKTPNISGLVKVHSEEPVQVGIFGRNNAIGWAGYFTGFKKSLVPEIDFVTSELCHGTIVLDRKSDLDQIQWFHNDTILNHIGDTLFNAPPGKYFVTGGIFHCDQWIRDTSKIVYVPKPLEWELDITHVPCNESRLGKIVLSRLSGGLAPLKIFINDTLIPPNLSLDSLGPGRYILHIDDANGCSFYDTVNIEIHERRPLLSIPPTDTITCHNPIVGIAAAVDSNTRTPVFLWSTRDGQILSDVHTSNIQVARGGWYHLLVLDKTTGCNQQDSIFVPEDVSPPKITLTNGHQIDCNSPTLNLTADFFSSESHIDISWSTQDGHFLWSRHDSAKIDQEGTYTVIIENLKNGCMDTASVFVTADTARPELNADVDTMNCLHTSVIIEGRVVNKKDIAFQWTTSNGNIQSGETSLTPLVSSGGQYQCMAMDTANGCWDTLNIEVIQDTIAPKISLGPDGVLTCRDSVFFRTAMIFDCDSCEIIWSSSSPMINLSTDIGLITKTAGLYSLLVHNPVNHCTSTEELRVESAPMPDSFFYEYTPPNCKQRTGEIRFTNVRGGVPPYQFTITGASGLSDQRVYHDVIEGKYHLIVEDVNGCRLFDSVTVISFIPIDIEIVEKEVCVELGDEVKINVESNLPNDHIEEMQWTPGRYLSCTDCLEPTLFPLTSEQYTLEVMDINGCRDIDHLKVTLKTPEVFIPNAFTPNGDHVNDGFTAFTKEKSVVGIKKMRIYDRWGELVFQTENIPVNQPQYGWQGDLNGRSMLPAVFAYLIEVEYIDGRIRAFAGDVTLVR